MKKRREILEAAGSAALMAMAIAPASAQTETLAPAAQEAPKHHIRFGVCGVSHDHIHGMIGAVQRGGGELVSYWGAEPDKLAVFAKRYPGAKAARSQEEVLHDSSLQLVMSSHIASQRAGIGVKAMKAGKDFLADKPGITTLEDLALVRKTIAETKRIYAILYSERLEVRAAKILFEIGPRSLVRCAIRIAGDDCPPRRENFLRIAGAKGSSTCGP